MKRFLVLMVSTIFLSSPAGAADGVRFVSGSGQTVMIELFTSQGCNSCPPAEAYLNRFTANPGLWKKFIPLAFHVDYWDYLGWKDRFAHPEHTQRQRQLVQQRSLKTVYTPALAVNGQGWRPSLVSGEPDGGGKPAGVLRVDLNGQQMAATFEPVNGTTKTLHLDLVVLGMGLTTEILAGENAGRRSQHEFVVLARKQIISDNNRWTGRLPALERDWGAQRFALVAWVSRPGDLTPLQATGGYLPQGNL